MELAKMNLFGCEICIVGTYITRNTRVVPGLHVYHCNKTNSGSIVQPSWFDVSVLIVPLRGTGMEREVVTL
jgi:hypothetical protein